jgi:hypothetical protein
MDDLENDLEKDEELDVRQRQALTYWINSYRNGDHRWSNCWHLRTFILRMGVDDFYHYYPHVVITIEFYRKFVYSNECYCGKCI